MCSSAAAFCAGLQADTNLFRSQMMPCRGWTVSVTQVLLMASPLSGLLRAIQQRSSANFHLGVCAMGLLSSSLWAIYAMVSLLLSCITLKIDN